MITDESTGIRIAAVGSATPECCITQKRAEELLINHYGEELTERSIDILHKVISHPSIHCRSIAVENETDLLTLKDENPDRRVERFTKWAVQLSTEALEMALHRSGISTRDLSALVVNTCTGYLCPGLSTYIQEKLDLPKEIPTYDLVGSGCAGALPNLGLGHALCTISGGAVASVAVEVCSATFEMGNDLSLIVSNSIFGDGAAAAILMREKKGPKIVASAKSCIPQLRDYVRFIHKDGKLINRLSPHLPRIVADNITPFIKDFLQSKNLTPSGITHWAVHPGGDKIISYLQTDLGLNDKQLEITRNLLFSYGNMSSPSVLFALEKIMCDGAQPGEWGLMVAFGAGFSMYLTLLQW